MKVSAVFHVYTLAGAFYLIWRFVLPLPVANTWRVIGATVLLGVSQYHALQIITFGTMFSPRIAAPPGNPVWMGVLYVCTARSPHVVAGRVQPGDEGAW